VVAAYPKGSPDIESSVSRVPGYTEEVKKLGVQLVDSIPDLLKKVDVVLLETNDGRPHLAQAMPVLKAGKRLFIDKPVAASLAEVIAIYEAARQYKVPVFSSSSLRYMATAQAVAGGKVGKVLGADAYSPAHLEKTHPDLFWYGIHGVETLYTVMGRGCKSVVRVHTESADVVVGTWADGGWAPSAARGRARESTAARRSGKTARRARGPTTATGHCWCRSSVFRERASRR
jgi:predicted dehydrogenase